MKLICVPISDGGVADAGGEVGSWVRVFEGVRDIMEVIYTAEW